MLINMMAFLFSQEKTYLSIFLVFDFVLDLLALDFFVDFFCDVKMLSEVKFLAADIDSAGAGDAGAISSLIEESFSSIESCVDNSGCCAKA